MFDSFVSIAKSPINMVIGFVNSMISALVKGLNSLINMLNKIQIPEDIPVIGGLGIDIPNIQDVPKIPYLATGAVIPANKEFLAVLGDQKHGTNVEAPLDIIKQATEESLLNVLPKVGMSGRNASGTPVNITIQVVLDRNVVGRAMVDWGKIQQMATGSNPYGLGTT